MLRALLYADRTVYTMLVIALAVFLTLYMRSDWTRTANAVRRDTTGRVHSVRQVRHGISYLASWAGITVITVTQASAIDAGAVHGLLLLTAYLAGGITLLGGASDQIRMMLLLRTATVHTGRRRASRLAREEGARR